LNSPFAKEKSLAFGTVEKFALHQGEKLRYVENLSLFVPFMKGENLPFWSGKVCSLVLWEKFALHRFYSRERGSSLPFGTGLRGKPVPFALFLSEKSPFAQLPVVCVCVGGGEEYLIIPQFKA